MVDAAVWWQPLSGCRFPDPRENTGNFADPRRFRGRSELKSTHGDHAFSPNSLIASDQRVPCLRLACGAARESVLHLGDAVRLGVKPHSREHDPILGKEIVSPHEYDVGRRHL